MGAATWWVVFTPLWLFFAGQFLGICVEYALASRLKESVAGAALAAGRDPEAPAPAEEEVCGGRGGVGLDGDAYARMCLNE